MTRQPESPFRLLAKTYSNHLVTREQYVSIRAQMLKKLESRGNVSEEDLRNFSQIAAVDDQAPVTRNQYSLSDWIIIALGLAASVVLGVLLYG